MRQPLHEAIRKAGASAVVLLLLLVCSHAPLAAAPAPGMAFPSGSKTVDLTSYFDANSILMFVTNTGSFAYDVTGLLGYRGGLYYPRGSDKTLIYAGGLWIGAKMGKGVRVAAAEYGFDFVPGPMSNHTYQPDQPRFRIYKINRGDTPASNPDYRDWPFVDGAPTMKDFCGNDSVDVGGHRVPLLLGDQTLWSVFNDANVSEHNSGPGSPLPLGVEVQVLVWGWEASDQRDQMVFMDYKIINKGDSTLRDAYAALWADPDLGNAADDLVGCDTSLSLGFCYNGGPDAIYGNTPPAVGYVLLNGPRADSLDRLLPMTAFTKYVNGGDPEFALEAYHYMQGRTRDGDVVIDPVTGQPTSYMLSGDLVAGTGWLDDDPTESRFILSSGPFTMAPSDTQEVVAAVIVGQGTDWQRSVSSLKEVAWAARRLYVDSSPRRLCADIDILPGQCPNILQPHVPALEVSLASATPPQPVLTVAILGAASLSVADIDPASIRLEGNAPVSSRVADVSRPVVHEGECDCTPAGGDGQPDLLVQFDQEAIIAVLGSWVDGDVRKLTVTARLNDSTPLAGADCLLLRSSPIRWSPLADTKRETSLDANAPNPFNAATTIGYSLVGDGPVRLEIFSVLGRRVATLVDEIQPAGQYRVTWDGRNAAGHLVASGMYFYRLTAGTYVESKKMILLK